VGTFLGPVGISKDVSRVAVRTFSLQPNDPGICGTEIRRECLNHVIVLNERHLLLVLRSYASYYHSSRTHRSLDDDCPDPRPVEPPEMGDVVALAQVGGLHHRYTRRLAA
jgi:hypothetical protein